MTGETPLSADQRPTNVRHGVVSVATLMALLLYLDRFAVGISSEYIREDLRMTQTQMSWFLSAFFWSYALGQVPAGWFSDRFGARRMLTFYILAWSAFTGLLGLAHSVWLILYWRLFCGVSQAGAYPTAGGLIRVWFPISGRGVASSIVALGGRAGGVLAPILTAWLIVVFSQSADPTSLSPADIVDDQAFISMFNEAKEPHRAVIGRLWDRFSVPTNHELTSEVAFEKEARSYKRPASASFDWRDWVPGGFPSDREIPKLYGPLLGEISVQLKDPALFSGVDLTGLKLAPEGVELDRKRTSGTELSQGDASLLNRLIVEAAFQGSVKRLRGAGWRPTMIAYGLFGLVVAIAFFVVCRDLPRIHPWCNDAERNLIDDEPTRAVKAAEPRDAPFPMVAMLTNLSLWGNSLMQVFTNIGWVFVVTWLPRYLDKVHGVPLGGQAIMTAIPTAAGILGMYLGGWWTDWATHYGGRKWGRRLPILVTRFSAGLGYGICLLLSLGFEPGPSNPWLPWGYVGALCLMAFSVDMGNPAVWAYAQDVGGKYTGSVLGWANMWGNLGAAVAPLIYNAVLGETPVAAQWNLMFGVCILAFALSALCSLVMDSTKPLISSPSNVA